MGRFSGFEEIYSALYVDFDNIYSRLAETDPEAARVFGSAPSKWVRWIENHALRILYGDGVKRRILKRACYFNPQRYQDFRTPFIKAAFQVIDCPPLTARGKTGADIRLVMDCMDDLNHPTRFDEFIIMSGDADFTPLLIRLRERARRTLVLFAGYSSPAYTAAASWRVREDWFVAQALKGDDYEREDDGTEHGALGESGMIADDKLARAIF
ncbi:MAG: NYN domain-containing protein [Desulfovibrio sp.]|nr:NYN domain-containing protein [Desulfovibrio sp.]